MKCNEPLWGIWSVKMELVSNISETLSSRCWCLCKQWTTSHIKSTHWCWRERQSQKCWVLTHASYSWWPEKTSLRMVTLETLYCLELYCIVPISQWQYCILTFSVCSLVYMCWSPLFYSLRASEKEYWYIIQKVKCLSRKTFGPIFCSLGNRSIFPMVKAARAWNWPLTCI
jgi:hypothetical protein